MDIPRTLTENDPTIDYLNSRTRLDILVGILDQERNYLLQLLEEYGHVTSCSKMCNRCMQCDCGLEVRINSFIKGRLGK